MSRQQNNLAASITKPNIMSASLTKPNKYSQPKPNNMGVSFNKPTQTSLYKPSNIVVSLSKPNNMATSASKTNKTTTFSQKHPSNKLLLPGLQVNNNPQGKNKKGKEFDDKSIQNDLDMFLYLIVFLVTLGRGGVEFSEEEKKIVADFLQQCVMDIQQIKAGESNC